MDRNNTIIRLLASKSRKAQGLGITIALLFFVPQVTDILENPALSSWGRVGRVAQASGQMLMMIGVAGMKPEWFAGEIEGA